MKLHHAAALFLCVLSLFAVAVLRSAPADPQQLQSSQYEALHKKAEQQYADGSYARARESYQQAAQLDLSAPQRCWVSFRIADSTWRAASQSPDSDTTDIDQARADLEDLLRQYQKIEDRDSTWASIQESLGDFWWNREHSQNWGAAWPAYSAALDFWAGSPDLDFARSRYLAIVWKAAEPAWALRNDYQQHWHQLPLEVCNNAIQIAQSPEDKAHAHFLAALVLRQRGGSFADQQRLGRELQSAIDLGKSARWMDDALFLYAQFMESHGRAAFDLKTGWRWTPDYLAALELYQRIIRDFAKGQSPYFDQARSAIHNITNPVVSVNVSNLFLPDSEIQYYLSWRNVPRIDLSLYAIDLTRDVKYPSSTRDLDHWVRYIDLAAAEKIRSWSYQTNDDGKHLPGSSSESLAEKLPLGAYLLVADAPGATSAREIVLVSSASLIVKSVNNKTLVYFADALTSRPIPGAQVHITRTRWDNNQQVSTTASRLADQSGLCLFSAQDFPVAAADSYSQYFIAARSDNLQAFAASSSHSFSPSYDRWKIYAYTDRPAYRPDDTVKWKFFARLRQSAGYVTPAGAAIEYEITDPQGAKLLESVAELNSFGSAWGDFQLSKSAPLGEYTIQFWDAGRKNHIGSATLFRMEEYKLPEFLVTVKPPAVDGKPKTFLHGETAEIEIHGEYYFGGPVANASVEVVIRQRPYYHWWTPVRDYPWAYEEQNPFRYWHHGDQVLRRETLRTDALGNATLSITTDPNASNDMEYQVEARMVDASRREITANGSVRVSSQSYFVHPVPEHNLIRPGDKAVIDFTIVDINNQPVSVEGAVRITRETYREIWIDPSGREVAGNELINLKSAGIFPPPLPRPDLPPWRLKQSGYTSEEILTQSVKTDDKGLAQLLFTPQLEGYYKIAWLSRDRSQLPITAETWVWALSNQTTALAYRTSGLEIIVDKDTFRSGASAPVMISTPTNDRHVLFCVEGNDLYDHQLVHVTGNVKLVQVPIDQRHIPNIYLTAAMMQDGQLFADQESVTIPPVEQYLNVSVTTDKTQYQPQEDATLTISTTNADHQPVSAEFSLALVDESVYYIQQDFAGDPRPFFFESRQGQYVQTSSTANQGAYIRLVMNAKGEIVDSRFAGLADEEDTPGNVDDDLSALAKESDGSGSGNARKMSRARAMAGFEGASGGARFESQEVAASPAPSNMPAGNLQDSFVAGEKLGMPASGDPGNLQPEPAVQVRADFRATILWEPAVITDDSGSATLKTTYADSLTAWKAVARAVGRNNTFGFAEARTQTKLPLIARLQAPRFFLVGDQVTLSGVLNNNTAEPLSVTPQLDATGMSLASASHNGQPLSGPVTVPPNGEARVDWLASITQPGSASLKLTARSASYADAMEKSFPVYEHGVQRFLAASGKVRSSEVTVNLTIPPERKPASTSLSVQVTPSMAVTMLDALPYLIDYPYGCTEQTMSRFLPAAIVAKTLTDLKLDSETAMSRAFGGIEAAHAAKTHPKGKKNLDQLADITRQSLDRLYDFQHDDGGWGWWKDGQSDHFMSAYVLWGLSLALQADLDVRADALDRAAAFLDLELVEHERNPEMQAWLLHALAAHHAAAHLKSPTDFQAAAVTNLWSHKDKLSAYSRALFALACHNFGDSPRAKTLVENLENGVKKDDRPDASVIIGPLGEKNPSVIPTAHWGEDGFWWRWNDGPVESTAFALRALLAIDPHNPLVEPVTNWLIKNRRGNQWSNTRDSAIALLALNDYLKSSGELAADLEYELLVNNKSVAVKKITPADVLSAPSVFTIDPALIQDGPNAIRIVKKSGPADAPIYFAAHASFFSLEEPIPPAGSEIFVRRDYFKLVPKPTLLKGVVYDRLPLLDAGDIRSGERIEVLLTIQSKNDYDYLVFEDLKAAGTEAVEIRSGSNLNAQELKSGAVKSNFAAGDRPADRLASDLARTDQTEFTGRAQWVYQELRDRHVALFIDHLPQGVWQIRYDLRAESPGSFHALPVLAHAMYVPEIRANSAESRFTIHDLVSE